MSQMSGKDCPQSPSTKGCWSLRQVSGWHIALQTPHGDNVVPQ